MKYAQPANASPMQRLNHVNAAPLILRPNMAPNKAYTHGAPTAPSPSKAETPAMDAPVICAAGNITLVIGKTATMPLGLSN